MEDSSNPTVGSIDSDLSNIARRLSNIEQNLYDGLFGEMPRAEDVDKSELATPSIASINQRLQGLRETITHIEKHVDRIHGNQKITA